MGLFGKQNKERKEIKKQVTKFMKDYDKEKIDSAEYAQKMIDLFASRKKKK